MRCRSLGVVALGLWWMAPGIARAEPPRGPIVGRAEAFAVSPPLASLRPASAEEGGRPDRVIPLGRLWPRRPAASEDRDPVAQETMPSPRMPAPLLTFEGLRNTDNSNAGLGQPVPPDTNGDIGPSHYFQAVNVLIRIFNRSGAPLTPAFKMSTLFQGLGGRCATHDDGDPIILYDPLADRWLVSQFAFDLDFFFLPKPPFFQCIAISQGPDPAGGYFLYSFRMPGDLLNDYPKFGVWPDAYYMTDNQFDPDTPSFAFAGAGTFAFDRIAMLLGVPTAGFIYFNVANIDTSIGGMLPADVDGPPPPDGTPNYQAFFEATELGAPQDRLRIFQFHADFSSPASSTFTERPDSPRPTAAFNPDLCGFSLNCIPQPSTSTRVDALSDRLLHRLQYRHFGDHESLVVTHSVDANGADKAGVRYYELRRGLPSGSFTIPEQATFSPDSANRWMGSAAMDAAGNLAVGYSVSSTSVFPSIRYAGRLASDAPNGLFQGEATLQAGAGSQTHSSGRWGDYSMLAVDPVDDCTFWYTTEYYSATSSRSWRTKVGTFKFPSCAMPAPEPLALDPLGAPITIGGLTTIPGSGFSRGSVVKLFVATSSGTQAFGPFPPLTRYDGFLLWNAPPTIPLGNGFGTIQVVNTDQGFVESNTEGQLLVGDPADNIPTVTRVKGTSLGPASESLPLAYVETTVTAGSTVALDGTGFNSPLVNFFTTSGNLGPLTPISGGTSTKIQVVIPGNAPTGPGSFQVVNNPFSGNVQSEIVSVVVGQTISVADVTQSGETVTVTGTGFSTVTVINFFNDQGGGNVANLGGFAANGSPRIPLTFVNANEFRFKVPAGAVSGAAFVEALNPPFIPFTSTGTDPDGAFDVVN